MAKKQKSGRVGPSKAPRQQPLQDAQTKYQVDETFGDSQDEFFAGKDQILLDNGPANKRRKTHEDDEFLQPSDEEVLGYQDTSSSEDDRSDTGGSRSDQDDRQGEDEDEVNLRDWGSSKADYYNADAIETEADALEEEEEARKLQKRQLQNLTEADFGFDEFKWTRENGAATATGNDTLTEQLPELEIQEDASPEEKAQIFKSRYPEFEPLARDFIELQKVYQEVSLVVERTEAVNKFNAVPGKKKERIVESSKSHAVSLATIKLRALSSYLGTIGMYFALLTSTSNSTSQPALAKAPAELRGHPVMQSLVRSKQLWERVRNLVIPQPPEIAEPKALLVTEAPSLVNGINAEPAVNGTSQKRKRVTKSERKIMKAQESAEIDRQTRIQKAETKLAALDNLITTKMPGSRSRSIQAPTNAGDADSDFGDEEALTIQEAAEKAQRKKSLRFYTSQIAQKSNKRGAAARDAGGDADLPYKERPRDRQARLMQEADKGGRANPRLDERLTNTIGRNGDDDDDDDIQEIRPSKRSRGDQNLNGTNPKAKNSQRGEDADTIDDGQAYYNQIATKTNKAKAAKNDPSATITTTSTNPDSQPDETEQGKRGIGYTISRNKGLTPNRRKEIRNPRVKKKKQYQDKLKKLNSIRPVYKASREGRGGYGGELTGIKTDVVRGIKL